jgi:fructose-1-phosphate kinase PfkB-like protein
MGYWAEISDMISIFDGLAEELFPTLRSPPDHVLIDPSDVGKRPNSEIRSGKESLQKIDALSPVTMSANRFETKAIADSLTEGTSAQSQPAVTAREQLGIARFISHEKTQSTLVSDSAVVKMDIPTTDEPVLSTGAGDHFNAGVVIGLIHGLAPEEIVALGNAVAGCFVRQGQSPSYEHVRAFLDSYSIENWL